MGSAWSFLPANRSPKVLTRASSPQRASATCSSTLASMRSGQIRRTSTRRTQGTCSRRARTARKSTAKKLPPSPSAARSRSARCAFFSLPSTTTSRTGKSGERSSACSPAAPSSSAAIAISRFAATFSWRGLSHMRRLEDFYAEVFVGNAERPRGHRHQAVAGHAGRGVDLEQPWSAAAIEHQVDAAPARAPQRLERVERKRLERFFLRRRQAAGADVLGVVGEILVLVVVISFRRVDPDERQRLVVDQACRVFGALDAFLRHHPPVLV